MENGVIQEAQLSSSSVLSSKYDADRARLNIKPDPDIPAGSGKHDDRIDDDVYDSDACDGDDDQARGGDGDFEEADGGDDGCGGIVDNYDDETDK